MTYRNAIKVGLVGVSLALTTAAQAPAQNALSVVQGITSSNITVATNRAIVVQSDRPFAEISVANPAIADIATLSENTVYVLGKVPGRTTLTLFGADGSLIANVDVRVNPDIAEFKERLAEILPGEPIEVRTANDGIVLSGTVSGARKLSRALELANMYAPGKVTNLMMVGGTHQVQLKVRFAEMSRSIRKSLGSSIGIANNLLGVGGNGASFEADTGGVAAFAFGGGGVAVDFVIEALETKGIVRTLAEPSVTAVSGSSASFFAGGEYPIVVKGGEGAEVEYKPYGVNLTFRPTVIDGNLINLTIDTEVSSIDRTVEASNPGFRTDKATTTVEMRDGQSFAIAGLLQDTFDDTVDQVPWLGDVPVLGALFRSADFTRKQTELVVIITPYLVTPTTGDALSMPTERMRIPTEQELFLMGTAEGSPLSGSSDIEGSFGYVME